MRPWHPPSCCRSWADGCPWRVPAAQPGHSAQWPHTATTLVPVPGSRSVGGRAAPICCHKSGPSVACWRLCCNRACGAVQCGRASTGAPHPAPAPLGPPDPEGPWGLGWTQPWPRVPWGGQLLAGHSSSPQSRRPLCLVLGAVPCRAIDRAGNKKVPLIYAFPFQSLPTTARGEAASIPGAGRSRQHRRAAQTPSPITQTHAHATKETGQHAHAAQAPLRAWHTQRQAHLPARTHAYTHAAAKSRCPGRQIHACVQTSACSSTHTPQRGHACWQTD